MTLHDEIAEEIENSGAMPFSRYMDLALYHSSLGFYATRGAGRRKDFITSPETGPLFGKLVATALDRWWGELGRPTTFNFVEVGAGSGTLARSTLHANPACRKALNYIAVEISDIQRAQHPSGVTSTKKLPKKLGTGVIFANELLDNLPFDLYESGDSGVWKHVCIDLNEDSFCETLLVEGNGQKELFGKPQKPYLRIPDQVEARRWLTDALGLLQTGWIVVIDYAVESYPAPEGHQWLRTYRSHGYGDHPLEEPGSQDITADVDISQLNHVRPISALHSQHSWLKGLGIEDLVKQGEDLWLENVAAPDIKAIEARSRGIEAAALLDPMGLGAFKVMEWEITS